MRGRSHQLCRPSPCAAMQRYIYVHQKDYGVSGGDHHQQLASSTKLHGQMAPVASHEAEWWSTESRALIHYVALWSAPDISMATVVRVLSLLRGSGFASAAALSRARTPVVWIASFVQDHGDWAAADFRKCRLLADCFEPSMAAAGGRGGPYRHAARTLVRRAVAQNPPREAGESRRVFPLDQLDLRVLPESLDNDDDSAASSSSSSSSSAAIAVAAAAATATTAAASAAPTAPPAIGGAMMRSRPKVGVTFARFEAVFGAADEAREEWELAEVMDGVGELYRGADCDYALQLYAVEISGRGKFKGQKRPLIFAVILDAGCAQGSVLQALYPQMPRIARLIESLIFRPAGAYEACIVDAADKGRRYQDVRTHAYTHARTHAGVRTYAVAVAIFVAALVVIVVVVVVVVVAAAGGIVGGFVVPVMRRPARPPTGRPVGSPGDVEGDAAAE